MCWWALFRDPSLNYSVTSGGELEYLLFKSYCVFLQSAGTVSARSPWVDWIQNACLLYSVCFSPFHSSTLLSSPGLWVLVAGVSKQRMVGLVLTSLHLGRGTKESRCSKVCLTCSGDLFVLLFALYLFGEGLWKCISPPEMLASKADQAHFERHW